MLDVRPTRTAVGLAVLIWLPFPALRAVYILPGLAWFALAPRAAAVQQQVGQADEGSQRAELVAFRPVRLDAYYRHATRQG